MIVKFTQKQDTEEDDMAMLTRYFQRVIIKGGFLRKGSSSKPKVTEKINTYRYYKCGKKDHFIKDYPL